MPSSQAFQGVHLKQLPNEIFGIFTDTVPPFLVEREVTFANVLVEIAPRLFVKWRITTQQDEYKDSNRPHVNSHTIILVLNDFRCNIKWRTTLLSLIGPTTLNHKAEVSKNKVGIITFGLHQNVFRLEVATAVHKTKTA